MRLPAAAHISLPSYMHGLTPDFRLEGCVGAPDGGYRGQMAVLVKPNGRLGVVYMAAIRPFRHLIVYPALMLQIARAWRRNGRSASPAGVAA